MPPGSCARPWPPASPAISPRSPPDTTSWAGAGGVALYSARSDAAADKKPGAPKPALTVTTARPEQSRLPIRLSANGNIAAWQEALIGSESNGLRLTEVRVNVGATVQAGQVLATFAAETIDADVAQARAAVMEAEQGFHQELFRVGAQLSIYGEVVAVFRKHWLRWGILRKA